jgi:hypothetical protein
MTMDGAGGCKRGPLGLVGAIALVVVVELGMGYSHEAFATFITASWCESGQAARCEALRCDVLCLGDSQVKSGVLPRVLARRLNRPAFNLSVVGGQAPSSYFLLDRALKAGARPRAVVVSFHPGLLASDCRVNLRQWPEMCTIGENLGLIATVRDIRLAGPLLLRIALPTLRVRSEIRAAVRAALRGVAEPGIEEARAYRRNWRLNAGAHVLAVKPNFRDAVESPLASVEQPAGRRWRAKPENLAFLRRFLALAKSRNIAVFWLMPTNSPGYRAVRVRDGSDPAYELFVRGIVAEFPHVTVLNPLPMLTDPSVFSDVCHVNRRGAASLSAVIAEVLASDHYGRRWVELDAGRPESLLAGEGLEDVGQSALALHSEAGHNTTPAQVAAGPPVGRRR